MERRGLETRSGLGAAMRAVVLLAVHGLLAASPVVSARAGRLEPVDEAARRPDFIAFRRQLQQTIARRDVAALLEVLHPQIKNSFGGDGGVEEFRSTWQPDDPGTELWHELGMVLALGGTFDSERDDTFVAPYVFSRWPDGSDPFEHVALIGSRVRVRAAPSARAQVLDTLSFSILRLGGNGYPQRPWTEVRLPDGRRGFVAAHLVRSPIDYRAVFNRVEGRWLMTMFLAGD